jgi:epoxide hydrolase-like predicted phosphatase
MSIRAVIWDFGGVLVRTMSFERRQALAAQVGLSPQELERRVFDSDHRRQAQLGAVDGGQYLRSVAAELNLDVDELMRSFFGADELDLELMAYIRGLRPQYKIGLLSNAMSSLRPMLTEQYPILDVFDELIISAEVGLVKPDAAIYALAVERLGVHAREAVFVDDFIENVEGARRAGLHAVHFRSRQQALAELAAMLSPSS